ncbi:hypothetical protein [Bradyrhizobium sp. LTSPM299]|uniref:hypothetical protein n=1 Tax=Bradyrhizobium sp. LTSPM299 TaxID=1619233 RepID=UPI0012E22D12|nr:hypothetical protein [Bradyrhizobium sp. LTSPM299]
MDDAAVERTKPAAPMQISRRAAVYVVQHVRKACRLLADADDGRSRSDSVRDDLYRTLLVPIYRAHPDVVEQPFSPSAIPKVVSATSRDIGRAAANRLTIEVARLQKSIVELGGDGSDRSVDESAARKAAEALIDAAIELSFAGKITFDAYPELFAKEGDKVPAQPRTAERDADFRKGAPPLGSVKLSDAALALIQSFMREVRRAAGGDRIAAIGWAHEQKSKGPGDAAWSSQGAGWILGAYWKSEVPPDVIDTVRGVEIVFSAEDLSALVGKTIDATKQKLFVRD